MLKPSLNTVQDVVRARADDTEDKRRLPDSVVEVLRESGFNRLAIPATLGGREDLSVKWSSQWKPSPWPTGAPVGARRSEPAATCSRATCPRQALGTSSPIPIKATPLCSPRPAPSTSSGAVAG